MGVRTAVAVAALLLLSATAQAYNVNGRHWPAMPIPYHVNVAGAPDFGDGSTAEQVIADAMAAWTSAPCAAVSFQSMGTTGATWARDGQNTIYFVAEDWGFGASAAGATLWLQTPEGQPMEVDLALNAADFHWVPGGGDATRADVVDPRSVIAHELGHWLGLSHSPDPFATMYQALLPSGVQATLAGDDLAGICSLYPNGQPGCASDDECGADHACAGIAGLKVCDEVHDPIGAPCDKGHLDCAGMCFISLYECGTVCAFTALDYSSGYCAPLCDADGNCPEGWECNPIPGQEVAKVCLLEPELPETPPEVAETVAEELPETAGEDAAAAEEADDAPVVAEGGDDRDPGGPGDAFEAIEDAPPADPGNDARTPGRSGGCHAGGPVDPAGFAALFLLALSRIPRHMWRRASAARVGSTRAPPGRAKRRPGGL